ncbi:SDR family NAD(P)-dependent oxidoreductase [Lichenicoccus sp.]|uniref:SDR family NAD(P)-dependent oxidoreductase n=1 Tax=Lichenicoccus sp. TaxID=2781899 RepID=UPI003D12A43D
MPNVVVTGGSRGLGLGIAQKLSASGFTVIAVARNPTDALTDATATAAQAGHGGIHFSPCDLADLAALPGIVKQWRAMGPLFGLVNNAASGTPGMLANMPDPEIAKLVQLNVTMPLLLTKYVVRAMLAQGSRDGRIVSISSIVALTGYAGLSVYSATKAALGGFTRALAREVGPLGITVNAVAPGFVDTEMTHVMTDAEREKIRRRSALGRLAGADDVANLVDYLFSDKARNITGTMMTVDAGNTA